MALSAVGVVAAYLIGSIPVGLVVGRLAGGLDIRRQGSGNIGATNVLRALGWKAAALTLVGDIVKGYVAATLARRLGGSPVGDGLGAVAAIVGNCWSVFLGFTGGKGVATGLGAFLALAPLATVPAAVVWLAVAATFRYVSLASLTACLGLPLAVLALGYPWPWAAAALLAAAIIVQRHRQNLHRLLSGTEPRLGQRAAPS
jgi:glycerol-3-phosphate acyltransferase PlsY